MTEAEWLDCANPKPMLDCVENKASERKLRLFATACCRHLWRFLTDERSRRAVEVNESFADGAAGAEELRIAEISATRAAQDAWPMTRDARHAAEQQQGPHAAFLAKYAKRLEAEYALKWEAAHISAPGPVQTAELSAWAAKWNPDGTGEAERAFQCLLCRDLFGPLPFRLVTCDPAWQTRRVLSLAKTIYNNRAFEQLPDLADALEKAGCTSPDVLDHCRGSGPHVRGCWVVDLLLSKR